MLGYDKFFGSSGTKESHDSSTSMMFNDVSSKTIPMADQLAGMIDVILYSLRQKIHTD